MKISDYKFYIRFRYRLEDFFETFGSIFSAMASLSTAPDWIDEYNSTLLDVEFENLYSERFINKLSASLYKIEDSEVVADGNISTLANICLQIYRQKWDKLFYLYSLTMGKSLETSDYNPIENYASNELTVFNNVTDDRTKSGSDTDTTTFNTTDEITKAGTETSAQESEIQQKPLKTSRSIIDEYGDKSGNTYINGIKDTTEYNRNYTQTDTAGSGLDAFESVDEKQIAGLNSSDYSNSEKNTHTESGVRGSNAFVDASGSGESTERTGKHSSLTVDGARIVNGTETEDAIQTVTKMNKNNNYSELSFNNRTDTGTKTGTEETEHAYDSSDTNIKSGSIAVTKFGNIGVMTASQMIESAWNGEESRNFILTVFKDVADLISLKCY